MHFNYLDIGYPFVDSFLMFKIEKVQLSYWIRLSATRVLPFSNKYPLEVQGAA